MWPDVDHPADPYPGAVPSGSYVHVAEVAYAVRRGTVDGVPLDTWLRARGAACLAARVPVLAYGSNRNPSKITWLRRTLGLGADPVVVLRARTTEVAAVWAAGVRDRDGARPAVLAAAPGVVEEHALWLATPEQIAVLDRCEGRDVRFRLARLRSGTVTVDRRLIDPRPIDARQAQPLRTDARPTEGGSTHPTGAGAEPADRTTDPADVATEPIDRVQIDRPWVYLGRAVLRRPLLVDGAPVRCVDVAQAAASALVGVPAPDDGLDADPVHAAPHPDEWPAALFVYGLLRPGQVSWHRVRPHAAGSPWTATIPGAAFDTGRGYPAWVPDTLGSTPGVVIPLRDPAVLLPELDAYEGPAYERVRVVADGTVCWAYAWRAASPPDPSDRRSVRCA